jgi:hypothetical protein
MNFELNNQSVSAETPNICPHCHVANEPRNEFRKYDRTVDKFISVWRCNYHKCGKLFATSHHKVNGYFEVERCLNGLPKGPIWPKPIEDLKDGKTIDKEEPEQTKFIKTYLQSLEAQSNGQDEIAGMGYRKAIEYLVKDWAIQTKPKEKEKILGLWLSGVIKEYFEGDLKDILERSTWLGNDQTHYNKLFEEYNIDHLKELIGLIMAELDRDFKKRHYIDNIEKKS